MSLNVEVMKQSKICGWLFSVNTGSVVSNVINKQQDGYRELGRDENKITNNQQQQKRISKPML